MIPKTYSGTQAKYAMTGFNSKWKYEKLAVAIVVRVPHYAELFHFTFLCRGLQRNVLHSHCKRSWWDYLCQWRWIDHRKELRKLTFRALALRRSETSAFSLSCYTPGTNAAPQFLKKLTPSIQWIGAWCIEYSICSSDITTQNFTECTSSLTLLLPLKFCSYIAYCELISGHPWGVAPGTYGGIARDLLNFVATFWSGIGALDRFALPRQDTRRKTRGIVTSPLSCKWQIRTVIMCEKQGKHARSGTMDPAWRFRKQNQRNKKKNVSISCE